MVSAWKCELETVFAADDQYAAFLRSAWGAHIDFAPFRERVKKAKELAPKTSKAARELAALLNEAGKVGGGVAPDEFYSVRTLLAMTDNHEMDGGNLLIWRSVRSAITGESRKFPPADQAEYEAATTPRQAIIVSEDDAEEAKQNNPHALIIAISGVGPSDVERNQELV